MDIRSVLCRIKVHIQRVGFSFLRDLASTERVIDIGLFDFSFDLLLLKFPPYSLFPTRKRSTTSSELEHYLCRPNFVGARNCEDG